jgi:hypothetical protein
MHYIDSLPENPRFSGFAHKQLNILALQKRGKPSITLTQEVQS